MKIGVIGANGKAGRRIAYEAAKRGHEVTAIVRDAEKMLGTDYPVLQKDIFDLKPGDLRGFDAVVSAYGLPFGGDHPDDMYQQTYERLIRVFEKLPDVRLLVVGGAASLYQDERMEEKVLKLIPKPFRKDPADLAEAYKLLRKSDINYTFFSPAVNFDPMGRRTGSYTLGGDVVILNQNGESYISYADYAVAMVDEIENGSFIRARFTAVSDGKRVPKPKPYYGIRPEPPKFEGLSQYREPFDFELVGQKYRIVMDNGKKYFVDFLDGHTLSWAELGMPATVEHYDCAKGAEQVYFVNFEFAGVNPRTNFTVVIDVAERLVTIVRTEVGYHKKYPYMTDSEYLFGALDIPGHPLPLKRHKFTAELLGKRIHWHYSPDIQIVHVYYDTEYIRVTMPEGMGWGDNTAQEWEENIEREPYDEPASYVKIRDGLYLVGCDEQNMARRGWTGNSMLFLIDAVRVHDVGRSFGNAGMEEGKVRPENYLFTAFGDFVPSDGVLEAKPNRYLKMPVILNGGDD